MPTTPRPHGDGPGVALVTGASSGIGRATALALHEAGFTTYASARNVADLRDFRSRGGRAIALDVTDEESRHVAMKTIETTHGGVDVLVNSAGIGVAAPMEELDLDALRAEFEVNVFGLLRMSQLVLPAMRAKQSGRIINIGSVGGLFTAPGAGAYHMSKYAVEALSDAMRAEVGPFDIHVSLLQPTGVRGTPFVDKQRATMPNEDPASPYASFKANWDSGVASLMKNERATVTPEQVATVVIRAATARRPRPRYPVGVVAAVMPRVRGVLSDRAWDRMMIRQTPFH